MTASKHYAACIKHVQVRLLLTGHCQLFSPFAKGNYLGGYPGGNPMEYPFRNPPGSAAPALAAEHASSPAR